MKRVEDEIVGNYLAAFGNHEAKCLTLSVMIPEEVYTEAGIANRMRRLQGRTPGWWVNRRFGYEYFKLDFAPIGLVATEVSGTSGVMGYVITARGRIIGRALAGILLDYSEQHPHASLIDLFASTVSTSPVTKVTEEEMEIRNRAPFRMLRIYRSLLALIYR